MQTLARIMKALSDETRLRIIMLLLERECCVCEVMQALGISETRASRNLGILNNAGLVQYRKEGLWSLYSIDRAQMRPEIYELIENVKRSLSLDNLVARDRKALKQTVRPGLSNRCSEAGPLKTARYLVL